eukprot:jgi/Mesvir1/10537/Mv21772-RA.1
MFAAPPSGRVTCNLARLMTWIPAGYYSFHVRARALRLRPRKSHVTSDVAGEGRAWQHIVEAASRPRGPNLWFATAACPPCSAPALPQPADSGNDLATALDEGLARFNFMKNHDNKKFGNPFKSPCYDQATEAPRGPMVFMRAVKPGDMHARALNGTHGLCIDVLARKLTSPQMAATLVPTPEYLQISLAGGEWSDRGCSLRWAQETMKDETRAIYSRVEALARDIHGRQLREGHLNTPFLIATDWQVLSNRLLSANVAAFLAAAFPGTPVAYLEVGSNLGLSMATMGLLLQGASGHAATLVSLDPYAGVYQGSVIADGAMNAARSLYDALGLQVEHVRTTSARGMLTMAGARRRFHLVYIDGLHHGIMPLADLVLATSLLHSGGVLMLDDWDWPSVAPAKLWCDLHLRSVGETTHIAAYQLL